MKVGLGVVQEPPPETPPEVPWYIVALLTVTGILLMLLPVLAAIGLIYSGIKCK